MEWFLSFITLGGEVVNYSFRTSGTSVGGDFDLTASKLDANLSGASSMSITVTDEIGITASGASALRYKGTPVFTREELSGASTVEKVD